MHALLVGALVVLTLVTGCGTPQVGMPVGTAAVLYADARANYATAKVLVTQACASGKWGEAECQTAKEVDIKAQVYRETIEKALLNPSVPIDWAQVMKYSEQVIGLLLKIGLTP